MVPFKVPESAPLIIEGAQAVNPSATNIKLERDATAPLKKKVSANLDDPLTGVSGEPTSTPLRSKNKQNFSQSNLKNKKANANSQKQSAKDQRNSKGE